MYLDQSTGSIIVQAVIAGVVGVGAIFKLYWRRLRDFARGHRDTQHSE